MRRTTLVAAILALLLLAGCAQPAVDEPSSSGAGRDPLPPRATRSATRNPRVADIVASDSGTSTSVTATSAPTTQAATLSPAPGVTCVRAAFQSSYRTAFEPGDAFAVGLADVDASTTWLGLRGNATADMPLDLALVDEHDETYAAEGDGSPADPWRLRLEAPTLGHYNALFTARGAGSYAAVEVWAALQSGGTSWLCDQALGPTAPT